MAKIEAAPMEALTPSVLGELAWGEIRKLDASLTAFPEYAAEMAKAAVDETSEATLLGLPHSSTMQSLVFFVNNTRVEVRRKNFWNPHVRILNQPGNGRWEIERRLTIIPFDFESTPQVILSTVLDRGAGDKIHRFQKGRIIVWEGSSKLQIDSQAAVSRIPHVLTLPSLNNSHQSF